jgi:hypothetical protein
MSTIRRLMLATAAVAAIAVTVPAQQLQPGWVFTPWIGAYVPTTDFTRFSASDEGEVFRGTVRHQRGVALGGNASYWFGERMGVEFGGAYAWSHADIKSDFESFDDHAYLMMGTAKMMFALLPPGEGTQLRLGVGPAVIRRGGTAYEEDEGEFKGLTNLGGAVSLCTRFALTDRIALRLRAEDFIYRSRLTFHDDSPGSDPRFDKKMQNDLVFSAGLQIGIFR